MAGDDPIDALFLKLIEDGTLDLGELQAADDPGMKRALSLARMLDGVRQASTEAPEPRRQERRSAAQIGPYKLLRLLGEGGMGEVWLAERCDGQVEQKVAIKRVRGAARFSTLKHLLRERRILARLSHPNIAHFLGADVDDDNEPYLVIEYIDGTSLDRYVNDRGLSLRARLELFLSICEAVDHAHRHLVVHRDLKPANVLVTATGMPKLLDFGIARLLEDSGGALTQTGLLAFTPRYAAPEQFMGEEITPAVDQYALGLILYELLCGRLPNGRQDGQMARIAAAVEAGEPEAPSQVLGAITGSLPFSARDLRGDLDAIVLRCLRHDPAQRYPSVAELSADLRRYLLGDAVNARGDARGYRLRRFLTRHARAATLGALALSAILVALVSALIQAEHAREQAAAAAEARDSAAAVNEFLTNMLSAPSDSHQGADTRVSDLLKNAAERVADPASGLNVEQRIAIHGVLAHSFDSLSQAKNARAQLDAGLALADADPAKHRDARISLLQAKARHYSFRCKQAETEVSIAPLLTEVANYRRNGETATADLLQADISIMRSRLADCVSDSATQLREGERALALVSAHEHLVTHAAAVEQIARARMALGELGKAETLLEQQLATWPEDPRFNNQRDSLRNLLLQIYGYLGKLKEARALAETNLAAVLQRHGEAPHPDVVVMRNSLASILFDLGEFEQALRLFDLSLRDSTEIAGANASNTLMIVGNRANVLKALHRYEQAEAEYRRVIDGLLAAGIESPEGSETRLVNTFNLVELLNERGRHQDALALAEPLVAEATRLFGADHMVVLEARDAIGVSRFGQGRYDDAERIHRQALADKQRVIGARTPYTASTHYRLGLVLRAQRREPAARAEFEQALAIRRELLGETHPDTRTVLAALTND